MDPTAFQSKPQYVYPNTDFLSLSSPEV